MSPSRTAPHHHHPAHPHGGEAAHRPHKPPSLLPTPPPSVPRWASFPNTGHGERRDKAGRPCGQGKGLLQGLEAPWGELSSLRGKERAWDISRPNWKGPLFPPRSCTGREHPEAAMSPSLGRQRSRCSHETQATGAVNRLSATSPFSPSGLGNSVSPSGLWFTETRLLLRQPPYPAPSHPDPAKAFFSTEPFLRKVERKGCKPGCPVSASVASLQPGRGRRVLVAKETLTSGSGDT